MESCQPIKGLRDKKNNSDSVLTTQSENSERKNCGTKTQISRFNIRVRGVTSTFITIITLIVYFLSGKEEKRECMQRCMKGCYLTSQIKMEKSMHVQ